MPDSIAIVVIAALLSLLPVFVLLWVYYMREQKPSVPGEAVSRFFFFGMCCVGGAVLLERAAYRLWQIASPETSGAFFHTNVVPTDFASVAVVAAVSFGVIALIEEGLRYLIMRVFFSRTSSFDQIIDGVQFGFALGLGFAFVENTLYFLELFKGQDFNTLVVVFFLRFLISTVGHMAFGGVMGYYFAMAEVFPAERRRFLRRAFLFPWLMHGLFDLLLSIQLSFYVVLLLVIPLIIFWNWGRDDRLFEYYKFRGRRLKFPVPAHSTATANSMRVVEALPAMHSCPNCYGGISEGDRACPSCGLQLRRRTVVRSVLPFLSPS